MDFQESSSRPEERAGLAGALGKTKLLPLPVIKPPPGPTARGGCPGAAVGVGRRCRILGAGWSLRGGALGPAKRVFS